MRYFIAAFLLGLMLSVNGCATMLLQGQGAANLTPEQIDAYSKIGQDVYWCFQIGGPPPVGNTTLLIMPKTVKPKISYGSNCQLMTGTTN